MDDSHRAEPTQETRPKKGKPVEIPVPTRKEVADFFKSVTGKRPTKETAPEKRKGPA